VLSHFLDTNIVVYAYSDDPKAARAGALLDSATISVQVLNEFAHVANRKLGYDEAKLDHRIGSIRDQVERIALVDEPTHDLAREISFQYKLSFYDSALIASALLTDCDTFYSEDMQHGMVVGDSLTIRNPFV
jgi:predicted nucleic acid-binding protein